MKNKILVFVAKCIFAFVSIFGLIFYAAHSGGSSIGLLGFFVSSLVVLFCVGFFLYAYIAIGSGFNQWMLNNGATDVDWLWFKSDPKGLEDLRAKANSGESS